MKPIRTLNTRFARVIAVCGKCGRKLHGGFGLDGDTSLAKGLRRALPDAKGKRAAVKIVETRCMEICPKRAVAMIDSRSPGKVTIVPERTPVEQVARALAGERGADEEQAPA